MVMIHVYVEDNTTLMTNKDCSYCIILNFWCDIEQHRPIQH